MKVIKTKGLIAAPYTCMDKNGNIKLDNVSKYAQRLKNDRLVGAFVAGTTGEGMLLDDSERKDVISEWVKHKSPDFKIIAHVGSTRFCRIYRIYSFNSTDATEPNCVICENNDMAYKGILIIRSSFFRFSSDER